MGACHNKGSATYITKGRNAEYNPNGTLKGNNLAQQKDILETRVDYAEQKYKEYAKALNYTNKARDGFEEWDKERKTAREELSKVDKQLAKYKSVKQAPDYFKTQVGVDISKYHNDAAQRFEKRGQYTIDISDMSKNEKTRLSNALRQEYSPYEGTLSGTWIFTIKKKKATGESYSSPLF